MLKEYNTYLSNVTTEYKNLSRKDKFLATLFTVIIGLLIIIPLLCLFVHFYMQFAGIRFALYLSIAVIVILFHLFLAFISPLYFISLETFTRKEKQISYKKLFIAYVSDWISFIFIIILGIVICIVINYMLY